MTGGKSRAANCDLWVKGKCVGVAKIFATSKIFGGAFVKENVKNLQSSNITLASENSLRESLGITILATFIFGFARLEIMHCGKRFTLLGRFFCKVKNVCFRLGLKLFLLGIGTVSAWVCGCFY
ncbi:MAG: hypothetical protein ACI4QL_05830 [Candidatus Fimimonas sp.]